jgi:hypothetical protein
MELAVTGASGRTATPIDADVNPHVSDARDAAPAVAR